MKICIAFPCGIKQVASNVVEIDMPELNIDVLSQNAWKNIEKFPQEEIDLIVKTITTAYNRRVIAASMTFYPSPEQSTQEAIKAY